MSLTAEESRLLGASDIPVLFGLSPWSGPVALWARIVHGWQAEGHDYQAAGHAAEDYCRALYRQRTGYSLRGPQKWRHPLHPWLRCSPDDVAEEVERVVELKRYNRLDNWGPEGTDMVPQDIWLQTQFQAGVGLEIGATSATGVDVSALLRGEHRLYHVPHSPEVYERCVEAAERFWADFVLPQRLPEGANLRLLEKDAEAILALWPRPSQEEHLTWEELPTEAQQVVRAWVEANRARRAWEAQEKALKPAVVGVLREAPGVLLPEDMGGRLDFNENAPTPRLSEKALRAALEEEPEDFRRTVLGLLERCTTRESTRPLVVR